MILNKNSNNQILNNCIGRVVVLWKDWFWYFYIAMILLFQFFSLQIHIAQESATNKERGLDLQ